MKYAVYLDSGVSLEVDYDADKEENYDRFRQDAAKKLLEHLRNNLNDVDVNWEVF